MRRILSLFTMLMLCGLLAFAQSRVVTGTVYDASGKPVPFASVVIKNGTGGVQTNVNGEYSIKVNKGDVLVISGTAFQAVDIPVGSLNTITTVLQLKDNTIEEVIVTSAFQTKRTLRSQSSNVQNVSAEQLNTVRAADVNNALAGKVAGAQIRSQSAVSLGRETTIRLRGENGLGVGSGPIYVVDGTILPNSTDVNPDDIEDISVLQGPASAALFGPQGSNGAIVITTKRARKGQKGIGIEINSGVVFDDIYIVPNHQNAYAGGAIGNLLKYTWMPGQPEGWKALDGKYYPDYSDDASWGPRMVGQEYIPWYAWYAGTEYSYKTATLDPQPGNLKEFYNKGITTTNNVNFSKAGDGYNLRASYTNLDVKGLIPNSYLKRNTFNTNFSIDLSKKLTFNTSINFIRQDRQAENNDQYSNQSTGSFNQWFHRDLDNSKLRELRNLRTQEGVYASWNHLNPTSYNPNNILASLGANYWFNPYVYFDLAKNPDTRNRLYGNTSLTYKINNDLNIRGTYRLQQLNAQSTNIYPTEMEQSSSQAGFNPFEGNSKAGYGSAQSFYSRQNYEMLATYSKKVRDISLNANAGFDILKVNSTSRSGNTVGGLNVPGLYSLANSKATATNSVGYVTGSSRSTDQSPYKGRGLFVRADVGYKNMLFLEGTFRKDYTSAEPVGTSINTNSIGASWVFSDLIKNKSILSYGKLRASTGKILDALGAFALNTQYAPSAELFNGNFLMGVPDRLIDPSLRGATNAEKEIGIETRFLKNRIGLSVTYWDRTNKDFPVSIAINPASGFSSIFTNAGEIAKTGVDVQFFANPVKKDNFNWILNATWGRLIRNEVVEIGGGVKSLVSASNAFSGSSAAYVRSIVGQPWGQLYGYGIKRDKGQPVLSATGFFSATTDPINYGSVLPQYSGGVQNSFDVFKNFTINVNIDYQYGGKFFSLSNHWGSFSGLTAETATLNDKGNSVRDAVADGGGVHVSGVDATGKAVDYYVDAQLYYQQFRSKNISEPFVYDLSFVKMREFSVGYKLPVNKMGLGKVLQNATFSVIARNPILIWSKTRDFDPSEISQVQGEDGQQPGTRSLGLNLRLGF